jgi:hypothetical protein
MVRRGLKPGPDLFHSLITLFSVHDNAIGLFFPFRAARTVQARYLSLKYMFFNKFQISGRKQSEKLAPGHGSGRAQRLQ